MGRYLGLISGTSQDGIDAVLADFSEGRIRILGTHSGAYPDEVRARLLRIAHERETLTLAELATLDRQVAESFADTAITLLQQLGAAAGSVQAIGSHGQTVFHDPRNARSSLQLGDPSLIAARSGLTVVADFRRKDVALGGEGAPLVPAFHHALFASDTEPRAVANLGGIGNLTLLPDGDAANVRGYDTGPGNGLMDEWALQHLGKPYDDGGRWAATGQVDDAVLAALLAEPYFARKPPKSTGRGEFHLDWARRLAPRLDALAPADAQRTLCELSARSLTDSLMAEAPQTQRLLVCGGGARNGLLMQRLRALAPQVQIDTTEAHGLHPDWVEAAAFAWLAMRTLQGLPGNLPGVTGASRAAVLGGIYPA